MRKYFLASIAGWAAALFVLLELLLPYLLRRTMLSRALRVAPATNAGYLNRLIPHYWLGYGLLGLAFFHAVGFMGPSMTRTSAMGLWTALVALTLLLIQVGLGLMLQGEATRSRRSLRTLHFATMIALCVTIGVHLALN